MLCLMLFWGTTVCFLILYFVSDLYLSWPADCFDLNNVWIQLVLDQYLIIMSNFLAFLCISYYGPGTYLIRTTFLLDKKRTLKNSTCSLKKRFFYCTICGNTFYQNNKLSIGSNSKYGLIYTKRSVIQFQSIRQRFFSFSNCTKSLLYLRMHAQISFNFIPLLTFLGIKY